MMIMVTRKPQQKLRSSKNSMPNPRQKNSFKATVWDEPLTDEQALLVINLFRSHTCMLEWQGQVSMLLGKLATSVSPKLFLAILNLTVKLLHQVTLPPEVTMKLTPPEKLKHPPMREQLAA